MKKLTLTLSAVLLSLTIFTSCSGNSIESDASEFAKLSCKSIELLGKAMSGDESVQSEIEKLEKEATTLKEKIEKKYTSDEDKKAFETAVLKAMEECK